MYGNQITVLPVKHKSVPVMPAETAAAHPSAYREFLRRTSVSLYISHRKKSVINSRQEAIFR